MVSSTPTTCRSCGRPLPADAPQGHCPGCLALAVLGESDDAPDPEADPADEGGQAPPDGAGLSGVRIDGYELLEELGRGGMGVVHRARQLAPPRLVALKLLDVGPAGRAEAFRRFERESHLIAGLEHPNIVRLYGVGEASGHPYFALELVDGESLETLARRGPLPVGQAVRLLTGIAGAVAHAHARRVIHRDLKPANVLIDTQGEPRVTDFGVARRLDTDASLTLTGQVLGTPGYLAPEQLRGDQAPAAPTADVYSLGAILYRLLTGRPPFLAENVEAMLLQVSQEEPVPVRRLNPSVPRDLEAICLKCLEKDPARRYPEAGALAEDLGRFREGRPVRARPETTLRRWVRRCRRRPLATALAGALTLSVALGAVGVLHQWRAAEEARRETQSINVDLVRLVDRLRLERAEELVNRGETPDALAELARLLREQPAHAIAAARTLDLLSRTELALPAGPPLPCTNVEAAVLSPDGRRLAVASWDGFAQIWDLATGSPATPRLAHEKGVKRVAFSPDGRWLASSSTDGTARVWEAQTGQPVCAPLAHAGNVWSLGFSADGSRLATTTEARGEERRYAVHVWQLPKGTPACPPLTNSYWFHGLVFCAGDRRVVAASTDKQAHVWEVATGRLVGSLPHESAVECLAVSIDGALIATGAYDGTARVWDASTLQPLTPPLSHQARLTSVCFSPDGRSLLTASSDRQARVFAVATGQLRYPPMLATGPLRMAGFSGDGSRVITVDEGGNVRLWDGQSGLPWGPPIEHNQPVRHAAFTPDGARLITVAEPGPVYVWSVVSGTRKPARLVHDEALVAAVFGSEPDEVVAVTRSRPLVRWDWAGATRLATGPAQDVDLVFSSLSPRGDLLAVRHVNQRWDVVDVRDGRILAGGFSTAAEEAPPTFSPAGRWLASKSQEGRVELRDLRQAPFKTRILPLSDRAHLASFHFSPDERCLLMDFWHEERDRVWPLESPEAAPWETVMYDSPRAGQFSPDGQLLAVAAPNGDVRLLAPLTGQPRGPSLAHPHPVREVQFTPDGARLVTVSTANALRVWDVATGETLTPTMHPPGAVEQIEVSPDGQVALARSGGRFVSLWDLRTGQSRFPAVEVEGEIVLARFLASKPSEVRSTEASSGAGQMPGNGTQERPVSLRGLGGVGEISRPWVVVAKDGTAVVRDGETGQLLNHAFHHGAELIGADISPDGRAFLLTGNDGVVSVWEPMLPQGPAPGWLAELAEAVAGRRFDGPGEATQPVSIWTAHQLISQLAREEREDYYGRWARGFCRTHAATGGSWFRQ
ncbi:MAG: protein kinase [Verrucomicrobiales bacterium]|nr:protein kinase [Verrucomicrobiales bacterium]